MKPEIKIHDFIELVKNAKITQDHHFDQSEDYVYIGEQEETEYTEYKKIYGERLAGAVWSSLEVLGVTFEFTNSWSQSEIENEVSYWEHENDGKALIEGISGYTQDLPFEVIDSCGELSFNDIAHVIRETRPEVYDFNLKPNFDNDND